MKNVAGTPFAASVERILSRPFAFPPASNVSATTLDDVGSTESSAPMNRPCSVRPPRSRTTADWVDIARSPILP
jgi:hypothetical protein